MYQEQKERQLECEQALICKDKCQKTVDFMKADEIMKVKISQPQILCLAKLLQGR